MKEVTAVRFQFNDVEDVCFFVGLVEYLLHEKLKVSVTSMRGVDIYCRCSIGEFRLMSGMYTGEFVGDYVRVTFTPLDELYPWHKCVIGILGGCIAARWLNPLPGVGLLFNDYGTEFKYHGDIEAVLKQYFL